MNDDDLESWGHRIYEATEFGHYNNDYAGNATLKAMHAFLSALQDEECNKEAQEIRRRVWGE